MDIEEKRLKIREYCSKKDKDECIYDCLLSDMVRCHANASDEEINRNYEILFGKGEIINV